ncbi:hypothetical protein [Bacillus sp. PS06]|uniref:hypothetical protein n=1 Tax=Bacillus sp. PS06 TaxID=2764176 RepID=UPI00177B114A|nr:hypothetical protein [Bacillus sp. PS06]MBD8068274.1 hypothetical protein [Bacillus sp. PS06]
MSLKLLELQIALPRTHDFGKITEQLNQSGQIVQHQLAEQQKKQIHKESKQVNKKADSSKVSLQLDERSNQETQQAHHPTKGKIIDISG